MIRVFPCETFETESNIYQLSYQPNKSHNQITHPHLSTAVQAGGRVDLAEDDTKGELELKYSICGSTSSCVRATDVKYGNNNRPVFAVIKLLSFLTPYLLKMLFGASWKCPPT
jgi:hypothetical protein